MDGIRAWGAPEPAALAAFYRRSELEILSRRNSYWAWSGVARLFHLHRSFLSGVRAVARRLVAARGISAAAHTHRRGAGPALVLLFTAIEIGNYTARPAVLVFASA